MQELTSSSNYYYEVSKISANASLMKMMGHKKHFMFLLISGQLIVRSTFLLLGDRTAKSMRLFRYNCA